MDTKINRTRKMSLVFIMSVLFFGFCFLSYSSKPEYTATGEEAKLKKDNIEEEYRTNFEEIYEHLDSKMRENLQKPVNLVYSNTRVDQVIMHLSKQIGMAITALGISERINCVYQNMPAKTALKILSKDKPWHWEKGESSLHIYPKPVPISVYLKFEEFYKTLDEETLKKLDTPVTLIFSNAKLEEILQHMSKQTGITIVSKGIDTRLSMIYLKVPAIFILENIVKSYSWKLEMTGGVIVITSIPEFVNIQEVPELLLRFYLFNVIDEPSEPFKVEILESCKNGDFENKLNRWVEEKSLTIIGSPIIIAKGNEPSKLEISGGDVDIKIVANDVRLQGKYLFMNLTVSYKNKISGTSTNMDCQIGKEGQFFLNAPMNDNKFQWNNYASVCKVESISLQNPAEAKEREERIQAQKDKAMELLKLRKVEDK